jgi:hypothetical protein
VAADQVTGWLGLGPFMWAILRVAIVWLAFLGAGTLVLGAGRIGRLFGRLPRVAAGMTVYMALAVLLSLWGLLTRTAVSVAVAAGAVPGAITAARSLRRRGARGEGSRVHPLVLLPAVLALYLVVTGLMLAARPELNFNDSQVTYMVQPDRWLNSGRMEFLDETTFSAFPMTAEILLVFPSSLSSDRLDQLILGQVFSHSLLIWTVFLSMIVLSFSREWFPAGIIAVTGCPILLLWTHFAKPDAFALFFLTVSLSILLRQIQEDAGPPDLSPYPLLGLALTSKLTAYPALVLFVPMYLYLLHSRKPGTGFLAASLTVAALLPLAFAVRTVLHTGSPFFPFAPLPSLLRPEWRMPGIELTYAVLSDRSSHFYPSVGFLQNIGQYFAAWNSSVFLLAGGYILTLKRELPAGRTLVLSGTAAYAVLSLLLYYPAWWGAKYGILLIPFAALAGLWMLRKVKRGLVIGTAAAMALYFLYESPLSPAEHWGIPFRNGLISSYVCGEWTIGDFDVLDAQPELAATLWMNGHLPPNSTVLSFNVKKRYFSDHRWIVAWRHPAAARLYLENSLEDEVGILEELGVDYVFLETGNPAPFDDENRVELFSRMGPGDLLDPVAAIDGCAVYRFDPGRL